MVDRHCKWVSIYIDSQIFLPQMCGNPKLKDELILDLNSPEGQKHDSR